VSLSNRQYLWHTALSEYRAHPIAGGGAGTFATYWLVHRPLPQFVVDAHSLYLQTLAEQGVIGLAALAMLLAPALISALRTRRHPLIPAALGAYLAFLFHAAVDWDWQVPAVTLVALISAGVILAQTRTDNSYRIGRRTRWAAGGLLAVAAALAALGLAASHALSAGASALAADNPKAALADAATAKTYAPWSDQPYIIAGRAQLQQGHRAAAQASFQSAVRHEPSDWVARELLMQSSLGQQRVAARNKLIALDPRYDLVNGRP
jgi:hypothetical protein